ncbi:MAG: sulfurtransferase TusA family protein, partial [Nitrososphaerales archaeon]
RFMNEKLEVDRLIDARNTFCPGPLMELIRTMRKAKVGEVIGILSSDTGSKRDIPFWAKKAGHKLIGIYNKPGYAEIVVQKMK